jgi:hypothetical protein
VPRRKSKYKITPVEAQRRRLEALDRWFQFINGEREITPENFKEELLLPTAWGSGRKGIPLLTGSLGPAEIAEVKLEITNGLKQLADKGEWIIPAAKLGNFKIVISRLGTSHEGDALARSLLGLSDLLQGGEEWRADRCAWCGKPFLKKKRGEYCSLNCSQRMRTKRGRDPRWKKDEAKAKKLGLTVNELRTAEKYACQECGAINLIPLAKPVFKCRKCEGIFAAEFGEATAGIVPPDKALELFRDLTAGEAREVFAQMLGGGQRNLVAKYLDGDPVAKAKVKIIQERILAGPLNAKSTERTDAKLKLKEKRNG